jgi:hypothetical protein
MVKEPLSNKKCPSRFRGKGICAQDWISYADPKNGLTQSLCTACGSTGHFYLFAFASKLAPLSNKKCPSRFRGKGICAQDWIRTSTPFRAPPPQSGVSTNFTTWALRTANIID